jgi:hypothetical protein
MACCRDPGPPRGLCSPDVLVVVARCLDRQLAPLVPSRLIASAPITEAEPSGSACAHDRLPPTHHGDTPMKPALLDRAGPHRTGCWLNSRSGREARRRRAKNLFTDQPPPLSGVLDIDRDDRTSAKGRPVSFVNAIGVYVFHRHTVNIIVRVSCATNSTSVLTVTACARRRADRRARHQHRARSMNPWCGEWIYTCALWVARTSGRGWCPWLRREASS